MDVLVRVCDMLSVCVCVCGVVSSSVCLCMLLFNICWLLLVGRYCYCSGIIYDVCFHPFGVIFNFIAVVAA